MTDPLPERLREIALHIQNDTGDEAAARTIMEAADTLRAALANTKEWALTADAQRRLAEAAEAECERLRDVDAHKTVVKAAKNYKQVCEDAQGHSDEKFQMNIEDAERALFEAITAGETTNG